MPLHRRYHHDPFIFQWPNTFCILSNATQTNLFLFVQCVWRSMSCFCSRVLSYHKSDLQLIIVLFIRFLLTWPIWILKCQLHRWKYELSFFYVHYDPFFSLIQMLLKYFSPICSVRLAIEDLIFSRDHSYQRIYYLFKNSAIYQIFSDLSKLVFIKGHTHLTLRSAAAA